MTKPDPATGVAVTEKNGSQPQFTDAYDIVDALRAIVMSNIRAPESRWIERFRRTAGR